METEQTKNNLSAQTNPSTQARLPKEEIQENGAVNGNNTGSSHTEHKKNTRRPAFNRTARIKPEFDQKIISIRRVTRVVTGGRRFNFSVGIVIGDRKGRVGVGLGKAGDTPLAIDKAVRDAKKNMISVKLDKHFSIPHEVEAKYSSSRVKIMKAPGKGILAGSSVRTVLEFAGIKEVSAKLFSRSKNKINNARAATKALNKFKK